MLTRYSSRKTDLGNDFLAARLEGAVSYDRIAGYFCSSFLEIAGEAVEKVEGKVRIICNSGLNPQDVKVAELAAQRLKQEWCEYKPEEVFTSDNEITRLGRLYTLLSTGKLEIRVLPDEIYGLMHGKAGIITYKDGRKTAFIGSMNETKSALTTNYEIVWEDDSAESACWVQEEFDFFWNNLSAVPLSEFVIQDIKRLTQRHIVPIKDWKEDPDADVAPVAVEEPIYRKESGLWAHQKYFVMRAFNEHKTPGGARLLLADMVGLGKTLQLAMSAKLMALYGTKPVLIIVPKTLLYQWQEEIHSMLDMPSAVWNGRCWQDEEGIEYVGDILQCPRKVGIISQGIITARTENADKLLTKHYECVICDEAHRARRKNLSQDADQHRGNPNNLLKFLQNISPNTHSMLLATATPVQISAIEAFDLLEALGTPASAVKVLGDKYSVWRTSPQTSLDYISGNKQPPTTDSGMWSIVRDPFPPSNDNVRRIATIRAQMYLDADDFVLPPSAFNNAKKPLQDKIRALYETDGFIENCNPYVRCIIRRTRDFLENTINPETNEPYLKKINVELYGEAADEALVLEGYQKQAYETAEDFCSMLSKRVKGGGFMSTLILKRIGSTMIAGENTAKKMLNWGSNADKETISSVVSDEDEDGESEMKDLTTEEMACLEKLVKVLALNRDTDPKYIRVKEILQNGVDGSGPWMEKGCIIFSQYYDSARYIAESLSKDFDIPIGLYAGGDKSSLFHNGTSEKVLKDTLKAMVKNRELQVLVGTDAASEGLNLQMLSTLINVDLPWNPTRLEQRKGRIQRIGQIADTIMIYNMRYKDSVEDKVHTKLSDRLKSIYEIFGQIPEVLEDVWIAMAENDEQRALEAINKIPKKNPFVLKYEMNIPECGQWENCVEVLSKEDKLAELKQRW